MTDLPVPGPPWTRKTTCWRFWPAAADLVDDRVVGDQLLVEERERRLVADHPGDVVEQALVRLERRGGDALEDVAVVGPGHAVIEVGRQVVQLVAGERRVHGEQAREVGVPER